MIITIMMKMESMTFIIIKLLIIIMNIIMTNDDLMTVMMVRRVKIFQQANLSTLNLTTPHGNRALDNNP